MKVTALDKKRCEDLIKLIDSTVLSSEGVNEAIGTAQVLLWLREMSERIASAVTLQEREDIVKDYLTNVKEDRERQEAEKAAKEAEKASKPAKKAKK